MNFVCYLRDQHITIVGPELLETGQAFLKVISWNDEEIQACLSDLDEDANLRLVFDFVDENITFDWVPKLLPWEKPGLEVRLKAKLQKEGALFVKFIWLPIFQTNEEGREEQRVLMITQLSSPKLTKVLSFIEEAQIPILALYSYTFLLEHYFLHQLMSKLKIPRKMAKASFLFVIRQDQFNFRQMFLKNGHIEISRNVELDGELENELAIEMAMGHETKVAVKYLYNQKIIPFNSEVNFVYLDQRSNPSSELGRIYQAEVGLPSWNLDLTIVKTTSLMDIEKLPSSCQPECLIPIFLHRYLDARKPLTFYRQAYVDKISLLFQSRKLFLWLNLGLILGGLVYFTNLGIDTYFIYDKTQRLEAKTAQFNLEKFQYQKRAKLKYDAEDIKATVDFSEDLSKLRKDGPFGFKVPSLITILSRHPHILMDDLKIRHKASMDDPIMVVELSGWVYPFKDEYRTPVKWVDGLVSDLSESKNYRKVILTKEPLDRNLKKALTIKDRSNQFVIALPFSIQFEAGVDFNGVK